MRTHILAKKKSGHMRATRPCLELYILPAIGHLPLTGIRRAHVSRMHSGAGHPGAANRALTVFSAIWNWVAKQHDDIALPRNPAAGIDRNPERRCERFLSGNELARLGEALATADDRLAI